MDNVILLVFALVLLCNTASLHAQNACPAKCCTHYYYKIMAGIALRGFTYKQITTADLKSCFDRCALECRCISFNICVVNSTLNCQLNEENRNTQPQALEVSPEFYYSDLNIDYLPEGENSNSDDCCSYNSCCETDPCLNGGQCIPNCDEKGKRFICRCPLNFTGAVCQTKRARNCVEVWDQGWRQSGEHVVLDQNENNLTLYCDLASEPEFIWTLVESFSLQNVSQFQYFPFIKTDSIAVNEETPADWSEYKLTHAHMQHVRASSTHWRATCNYPTRGIDYTGYLRTSFDKFDLLVEPVTIPKCQAFELINIREMSCINCTAGALYGGNHGYTFHIAFSCTESAESTTQIWFGRKK